MIFYAGRNLMQCLAHLQLSCAECFPLCKTEEESNTVVLFKILELALLIIPFRYIIIIDKKF